MHKPILIKNFELCFPHKTCFDDFNYQILYGSRIGIIGQNGCGKSSLLKMIFDICENNASYVPQIIEKYNNLSGSQKFNKSLSEALSSVPDILLLDEPTNHLDRYNRQSLMRMLHNYAGTLIIVSHDQELLNSCTNIIWHIENGKINIFNGVYNDYIQQANMQKLYIENEIAILHKQKKQMHEKLMQEQARAAKSKVKGEKSIKEKKWPTVVSNAKASRAQENSGRKKLAIDKRKSDLIDSLDDIYIPKTIKPKFSIKSSDIAKENIIQISNASIGYSDNKAILSEINFSLNGNDRIAIVGDNASGKSTFLKALLHDKSIYKTGYWYTINKDEIGYLDQHYKTLNLEKSVFENIQNIVQDWSYSAIRSHLNDFLFKKNEEINALAKTLSGGEKVRLSLAQIAAKTPKLLILDEITNNLDLPTIEHVIQILKSYPAAIIVVSHDNEFLYKINVLKEALIKNQLFYH